jgi:uncharacterized protein YciI
MPIASEVFVLCILAQWLCNFLQHARQSAGVHCVRFVEDRIARRAHAALEDRSMSYFVVLREAGPAWIDGKSAFEQPEVNQHAAFMNALAEEGIVMFAGPVAGSERERIRVLLVVDVHSQSEIQRRLADDPWTRTERLTTTSVEPWNVIVGAERIAGVNGQPRTT